MPRETAAISARSVYTIQPCTMSRHFMQASCYHSMIDSGGFYYYSTHVLMQSVLNKGYVLIPLFCEEIMWTLLFFLFLSEIGKALLNKHNCVFFFFFFFFLRLLNLKTVYIPHTCTKSRIFFSVN